MSPLTTPFTGTFKEQICRWLSQKVISPSQGPWASPIVPVPKKNGDWRFAIDYRVLNLVTKKDARPVAHLNSKLANLKSAPERPYKYWSSLDLGEAYHLIDVHLDSKEKLAMISPLGLFEYNKMSFGLSNAPQHFQELVQLIEKGILEKDGDLSKSFSCTLTIA